MMTRKQQAAERAALVALLGWAPEPEGASRENRYAATTGELWKYAAERFGADAADRCRNTQGSKS